MRLLAVSTLLVFISLCGWAAESKPEIATNAGKPVWIIPLANQSEARFPNSKIYQAMIQNSLMSFLQLIPGLDIADIPAEGKTFQAGKWPVGESVPEFILTGSYKLQGDPADPELVLEVLIYTQDNPGTPLAKKTYRTPTGLDFFDALDRMIADAAQAVVKTDVSVSMFRLSGFEVGTEPHFVFMNDRLVAIVTNNSFSQTLKIPADTEYRIEIKKFFNADEKTVQMKLSEFFGTNARSQQNVKGLIRELYPVYRTRVKLALGQSTNIGYQATGRLEFYPVRNARDKAAYTLRVNDSTMPFSTHELVLPSGTRYRVAVVNGLSNEICVSNFYLYSRYDETNNHDLFRPANPYWKMVPQEPGVLWSQPTSLQADLKYWIGGLFYGDVSKAQKGLQLNLASYFSLFEGSWNPIGLEFEALSFGDFEDTIYSNASRVYTNMNETMNVSVALGCYLGDWGNIALKALAGIGFGFFDNFCGTDIKVVTTYDGYGTNSKYENGSMFTFNLGLGVPVKLFSWLNWDNAFWFYTDIRDYHLFRMDTELQARWSVFVFEAGLSFWAVPGYREVDIDYNIGTTEYFAQAVLGYAGAKLQFDF